MKLFVLAVLALSLILAGAVNGQTITGAWKGKLGLLKTELKLVKKGDSILGTSYYYASKNSYRRYSIKGYFDPETNSVIWWDDVLIEEKGSTSLSGGDREPFLSVADFNCPGEDKMYLQGNTTDKNDKDKLTGPVNMQKTTISMFSDEWDFVIENYFVGANNPELIDSVAGIAFVEAPVPKGFEGTLSPPVVKNAPVTEVKPTIPLKSAKVKSDAPVKVVTPAAPVIAKTLIDQSIDQKFSTRTNKLQTVIPVTSEKIELRFYDNAQVDGDSIALFLNGKMLFKNIRLTEQAYTVYLNASDLQNDNELVMVAENLGSIPPNTSFMVAIVGTKRYEARLYANENSSALIRFVKQ